MTALFLFLAKMSSKQPIKLYLLLLVFGEIKSFYLYNRDPVKRVQAKKTTMAEQQEAASTLRVI